MRRICGRRARMPQARRQASPARPPLPSRPSRPVAAGRDPVAGRRGEARMKSLVGTLTSSIGMKIVMAVTGAGLVIFVIGHMLGNLEFFAGQDAINAYAKRLRFFPPLLWAARIGLASFVVLHIA